MNVSYVALIDTLAESNQLGCLFHAYLCFSDAYLLSYL